MLYYGQVMECWVQFQKNSTKSAMPHPYNILYIVSYSPIFLSEKEDRRMIKEEKNKVLRQATDYFFIVCAKSH